MSLPSPEPSALSRPQRHCQLLLLLYLPWRTVTLASLSEINRVESPVTRQDIAEVAAEIQRYHRLELHQDDEGGYRICGAELDLRLCLFRWLRRALRLAPDFVKSPFSVELRQQLTQKQVGKALYDEHNLLALIQHCSLQLAREFSAGDRLLLQLIMQHSLCRQTRTEFSQAQQAWLSARHEYQVATEVVRHWQKHSTPVPHSSETGLLALMFCQMHTPSAADVCHQYEHQLLIAIRQMTARFHTLSGMPFSNDRGLVEQLYCHISQALERQLFGVGIDHNLTEEVTRLYPRLYRTTQAVMRDFEQQYALTFSQEEMGLIAIIFGAGLMQESALQEKQVLLLTGEDPTLEREVERQVRELTLLPLTIRYLDVKAFQLNSAPKGTALVITPYAITLPLYSPPLIHAELPLQAHQQARIRQLLES